MRGYLTGVTSTSIWTAYERGDASYCGHVLPKGLRKHERLPEPLLTPSTKAKKGEHDEPVSRAQILERGLVGEELYDRAAKLAHTLFREGQAWAASRGLILADTKYELGLDEAGTLVVADEIHTPDSSRYWYADSHAQVMQQGGDPRALDKEYVRRWLASERGYRGEGAPPALTDEVRCEAASRYIEAYERVTGQDFVADTEAPEPRIRRNLGLR
jgi:phosphoribosylaminoimidazole-succinocarboxamide synthase